MKRLPIIRHIRAWYCTILLIFWIKSMGDMYLSPSESDLKYIEDIWNGVD